MPFTLPLARRIRPAVDRPNPTRGPEKGKIDDDLANQLGTCIFGMMELVVRLGGVVGRVQEFFADQRSPRKAVECVVAEEGRASPDRGDFLTLF
jgi:hypothetical protein